MVGRKTLFGLGLVLSQVVRRIFSVDVPLSEETRDISPVCFDNRLTAKCGASPD